MTEATPAFAHARAYARPAHRRTPGGRRRHRPCGRLDLLRTDRRRERIPHVAGHLELSQHRRPGRHRRDDRHLASHRRRVRPLDRFDGRLQRHDHRARHHPGRLAAVAGDARRTRLCARLWLGRRPAGRAVRNTVLHRHACRPLPSARRHDRVFAHDRAAALYRRRQERDRRRSAAISVRGQARREPRHRVRLVDRAGRSSAPSSSRRPSSATGSSPSADPLRQRGRRACRSPG